MTDAPEKPAGGFMQYWIDRADQAEAEVKALREQVRESEERLNDKDTEIGLRSLYQQKAGAEIDRLKIELKESQWLTKQAVDELQAEKAKRERLEQALKTIAGLDPSVDSDEGWNEWGESDCFKKAQIIARKALGESWNHKL
jgi:hypothetical protein